MHNNSTKNKKHGIRLKNPENVTCTVDYIVGGLLAAMSARISLSSTSVGPQFMFQGTDTSIFAGYLSPEWWSKADFSGLEKRHKNHYVKAKTLPLYHKYVGWYE